MTARPVTVEQVRERAENSSGADIGPHEAIACALVCLADIALTLREIRGKLESLKPSPGTGGMR